MYKEQFPLPCTVFSHLRKGKRGWILCPFASAANCTATVDPASLQVLSVMQTRQGSHSAWLGEVEPLQCFAPVSSVHEHCRQGQHFLSQETTMSHYYGCTSEVMGSLRAQNGVQWGNGLTSRLLTAHKRINKRTTWETCGNEQERCAYQEIPKCSIKFNI